jgi:hypothetical protein
MKKNVGKTDKMIRVILALLLAVLVITGVVEGTLGIVLIVVAAILLFTTFVGFCGLYTVLGISTCPVKSKTD